MPVWRDPFLARCQVYMHRKKVHLKVRDAMGRVVGLRCPEPPLSIKGVLRDQEQLIRQEGYRSR